MERIGYETRMRTGITTNKSWVVVDRAPNLENAKAITAAHERSHPYATFKLVKVTEEILHTTNHKIKDK